MSITLELTEDLANALHVPANELPRQVQIELACALYARGVLTHAQAATLAGLDRFGLGEELAIRDIPARYTEAHLAVDLAYGRGE